MICFVGDAGWDVTLAVAEVPRSGGTAVGRLVHSGPAGGSANSAATAARLGVPVTLIASLGEDQVARDIEAACALVDGLQLVAVRGSGRTQTSAVLNTPSGERTVIVGRGDTELAWNEVVRQALTCATVAHINVEDATVREQCWKTLAEGHRCLPLAHLDEEAAAGRLWDVVVGSAADHDRPDIQVLERVGTSVCVVTEGREGGWCFSAGGWRRYEPVTAQRIVDSTGAGDAFLGALLAGLHGREDLRRALERAARAGANALGRPGSWPT